MSDNPKPSSPPDQKPDQYVQLPEDLQSNNLVIEELEKEANSPHSFDDGYPKEPQSSKKTQTFELQMSDGIDPLRLIRFGFIGIVISIGIFAYMQMMLDGPEIENFDSTSDYNDAVIVYEDDVRINQALYDFVLDGSIAIITMGIFLLALEKGENQMSNILRIVLIIGSFYLIAYQAGIFMPFVEYPADILTL